MIIKNNGNSYEMMGADPIGQDDQHRLYLCKQVETSQQCLLLIATDAVHNGELDRNAYMLQELKRHSDEVEADWQASGKPGSQFPLNYALCFPELVDNFNFRQQGGRQVNILTFRAVEDLSKIVPISRMVQRDRLRIDVKTSAWIMGKLLKLLAFTHSVGVYSGSMDPKNVLLQLEQHYVTLLNWMKAQVYPGDIPSEFQRQEIQQAAKVVILALGGDPKKEFIPEDPDVEDEHFARYREHLFGLARGTARNAMQAHQVFYELVRELWGRQFHPYKTYPI